MSERGQILIVEDQQVQRMILHRQLERMGYKATAVPSGEAALELLARQRFDAVLMDCQMPGLDGYETTRRLRRRESTGERTVVIAVTATHGVEEVLRCTAAGMDAFAVKPVGLAEVEALLETWLAPCAAQPSHTFHRPDAERAVTKSYLGESLRQLQSMHAAIRAKDLRTLASTAHAMAGNSSVLDVLPLAEDCRELEALARRGDLTSCERELPRIERTFRNVSCCMREMAGSVSG